MKNFISVLLLLSIFLFRASAQTSPSHVRISIITCGPGDEIYSLFGHTALRITDSSNNSDIVYNWGTFSFDEPNFYLKFLRGNLLYYVSADNFSDFTYEYVYEHRSIYEQVLNGDSSLRQKILDAVNHNMQGSNRFYKYDFLLDNCTTRVKNIVFENSAARVNTEIIPKETTSRDLIHYYLERGGKPWTELGIDILLGSPVDREISNDEAMFLPEFFMKGLDHADKTGTRLIAGTNLLLAGSEPAKSSGKFIPLILITIICLAIFIISTVKQRWAVATIKTIDALLLYVTGLIGIIIMFMWFGTEHTVCQNNFNIAWALPTNLIAAFFVIRKRPWLNRYFFVTSIIAAVTLATWFWMPQHLNIALLPVLLLLLNRYIKLAQSPAKKSFQ